jgi:hypothetical protein
MQKTSRADGANGSAWGAAVLSLSAEVGVGANCQRGFGVKSHSP